MVLTYTDSEFVDVGDISLFQLDMSYGTDENDFELTIGKADCAGLSYGSVIYAENDIGGIVDGMKSSNDDDNIVLSGRTFSGLLNSRVVVPQSGVAYYIDNGDAKAVIRRLIGYLHAGELFYCDNGAAGVDINCKWRYAKAYDALSDALAAVNARLILNWSRDLKKIVIDVEKIEAQTMVDNDNNIVLTVSHFENTVNHLICLGGGELEERTVIHLYLDGNGDVTTTQYYTGKNEYTDIYDYPNAESAEQLVIDGAKKLLELEAENNLADLQIVDGATDFEIGDKISATEYITGVQVESYITQKIIKTDGETLNTSYKVGG